MRRAFILSVIFVCLFCMAALCANSTQSSGLKTTSGIIKAVPCLLTGVLVITDGTNAATVILYDNASTNSGTVLWKCTVVGAAYFGGATFEIPVRAQKGVYMTISGTGANAVVYSTSPN